MLLPEGYITTPDQSFGRTVWEMGSVGRARSWKTCSLGSLRFHTTAYRQQSSRVCNPKEDKEFGLRYCSTFQSGVLATAVGTSAGQNQQAQTCCCKIPANRDLAATSAPLPRHVPNRDILGLQEHRLQHCNLLQHKVNQCTQSLR